MKQLPVYPGWMHFLHPRYSTARHDLGEGCPYLPVGRDGCIALYYYAGMCRSSVFPRIFNKQLAKCEVRWPPNAQEFLAAWGWQQTLSGRPNVTEVS